MARRDTARDKGKSGADKPAGAGAASAKSWAAAKTDPSAKAKQAAAKSEPASRKRADRPKAQSKQGLPSDEAIARAKERLRPPPAPWHPLPLAELAIALGFLAILLAAYLADRDGVLAGFVLIMVGTAEFSWREHRHGYRPHATALALILGFCVGVLLWRVVGLNRNVCIGVALVIFAFAWGILDREYVPAAKRAQLAAEAAAEPDVDGKA